MNAAGIDPRHDGENLSASCDSQADFVIKLVSAVRK